eukprot:5444596-Amphidinium_carterae.1
MDFHAGRVPDGPTCQKVSKVLRAFCCILLMLPVEPRIMNKHGQGHVIRANLASLCIPTLEDVNLMSSSAGHSCRLWGFSCPHKTTQTFDTV